MTYKTEYQVGPGLPSLIFITFLVLKLTDVIDWSWWWVTSPLWLPLLVVLLFMTLIALPMPLYGVYDHFVKN